MLHVPPIEECIPFAKDIGASWIGAVVISPSEQSLLFQCHQNCDYNPVTGIYFAKDSHGILHGYKHSVVSIENKLIDNTPTLDSREYNIFCHGDNINSKVEHFSYVQDTVFINKQEDETVLMYYVYGLIDPRTNQPFYIGKGKDNRRLSHFTENALKVEENTRKTAKIKKLKSLGYSPHIEFYAQNIIDEEIACGIEELLVKKYGCVGLDEGGILTNINHGRNSPLKD